MPLDDGYDEWWCWSFQVRRSAQQIDELLSPDSARSAPWHCFGCSDTPTDRRQSQHTVTPAAHRTDTAPNTPPRRNPRSIETRPTPRTHPRATRAPMPGCPNQRHIRARPPTQIMYRIRRHPPTTPRARAPRPKLLTTRTNRWDIPRMSTRTSGGPPGVPGLLDHETQIRPSAHKPPRVRKRSEAANLHYQNGGRTWSAW
jgi:hypothetical protein